VPVRRVHIRTLADQALDQLQITHPRRNHQGRDAFSSPYPNVRALGDQQPEVCSRHFISAVIQRNRQAFIQRPLSPGRGALEKYDFVVMIMALFVSIGLGIREAVSPVA
jgi:hypothetical protein